jgi:hypothetical protein
MAKPRSLTVRRVATKEDRKRPSIFFYLKTDEQFIGYSLFEPDPELENNPGYYEYYTHWDNRANTAVPCVGEDCPFCAVNDSPSVRALTAWYFPDNDKGEQFKIFGSNKTTLDALSDEAEDEDGLLGKMLRIKRLSDKGEYRVKVRTGKPLSKTELKKLIAEFSSEYDLEAMVLKQAQVQLERISAQDALEEEDDYDEDEDEETPKPSRKSKAQADEDEEDEDEEDETEEEDEDEEETEEEDEDEEEDEEEDEDEEDEEEAEEEDEEENATISGKFTVVRSDEEEDTVDLKDPKGKTIKVWRGDGVDLDYDKLKRGTPVTVEAIQDDEGDWVMTEAKIGRRTRATR